jgi:cation transport ATPase
MNGRSRLERARNRLAKLRSERLGRLVIGGIVTLPLLADVVTDLLGFEVFYLADPKLQVVWGSLAQVLGGVPLYQEAWLQLRRGTYGRPFWFALAATLVYAAGLVAALAFGIGGFFLVSAGLILAAYLVEYLRARRLSG